jgi:amino acid adenylation domain-containing protein/thioester reductase-like protein
MAPGVLQSMVDDVLVLTYDSPQSLELIKGHANELAAVLVEPVPSRQPNLQPLAFLQQLRHLTKEAGIALIFDECITGFRLHPGGAQAWFGIEADIVTYAKLVGGGMPIGIIAGKSIYMDKIDGGLWRYGDDSYPEVETTFFAGTFCKHPLAMAAARAVLKHLKMHGSALQEQVNQRTSRLAETLNAYFEKEGLPIQIWYCGSVFRFASSGNFSYLYQPLEMDLLVHHLIEKGVYIWEGRSCFLSTAHSEEDIDRVIQAVKDSVEELQKGGFFTKRSFALSEGEKVSGGSSVIPPDPLLQQSQQLPLDLMLTPKNIYDSLKPELARKVSLNEAQKQLGILAQMSEDGSVAYNVSISLELRGSFQLAAMRKAVQTVVNRHEALRTIISSQNDFQEILPFLTADVALVDFSNGSDACGGLRLHERELQVADWLKKESQEPFDLNNGPLFRFSILKLEEKIHLLVLTIHHIVVDGWSVGVILQELGALYSAECQGVVCRLEPPMQFRKYIEWQEKQSQTDAMAAHESYWLEQFAESIPVLDLPTDRHHPRLQTYKGSRQTRRLDVSLTREVKRFSTENGCTLLMTLLSVYTTLLHRLTGQNDIIVGMPTAGRSLEGSEKLVGYCAHILLVRSCIVGSESVLEYLRTLKNRLLEIYEHQDYPFARLIDKLNVARDASRSPLVTAIFNWDRPVAVPKMFELATDLFPKPISCTPFDISLNVIEVDRKLVLDCDYNTDLCDASTIDRWLGHFQTLLEGVVANPQQCIAELPLLTEAERHQILVEWNNTTKEYPFNKCIHQLFEEQVERTPDAVAVVYENQQLTYDKLNCRANQLAQYLRSLGVGPEVLVGICMERSLEMVVGLLGILKAGGAYMPLDPEYPIGRLCFMLEDSAVSVLLTQQRLVNRLPEHGAQQVFLDDIWEQIVQNNHDNPVSGVRAFHLANVIYTSGSTGTPKGVMVTHTGLCNLAQAQIQTFGLQNLSRILQFASLSFDASIWEVVMALGSGATLYLGTKDSLLPGMPLIQVLRDYCITHITLPPSALSVLPVEYLPTLQTMIVAGEACSPELITQWSAGRNFFNAYGPTEATVCATVAKCTDGDKKLPIGRPIANTQIYILDSNVQPVPIGVPGELHIGGAGLARGYLNRPELTTEKFIPNPFYNSKFKIQNSKLYKTGDLARYLPDGNIEYLGRIDNQIKIRGFRIELGEIEAILSQHPGVRENVVVAREDILGEKRLVAYFVPQLEQTPTTNDLRIFLKEKLPQYMMPSAFVSLKSLPLTSNGKVDRKALPVPDSHNTQLAVSFVAPRTPVEKVLADIWANVLHLEQVGVLDNFFELGGHSLSTIRVMSQVNKTFQIKLPLRHLFTAPTIAELAQTIKSTCGTDSIVSANEITPLNLQAEVVLDETIKPLNLVYQPVSEPKAILLTGATGFVGAFLLVELLQQTQADIYCLVRAANLSAGKQRLQETLKAYLLWEESFNERIIPVLGDLSQPLLGLSDEQFHLMALKIDSIYHNGALVNDVYPYALFKAANVRGTEEVLRLASQIKIKPVHFISTASVFVSDEYFKLGVVLENDPLEHSQGLVGGYPQSKWVAEKMVMMARDRGLPCSIYRLGRITWHSQTGVWNSNDMFYRFIKACIQLKSAPEMNNMVEITPVDYLAKVLIHLSQQPDSLDKAFHLMNSDSAPWSQFINCIRSLGYPLQQLSYEDWQAELLRNTQISSDNALYSAISLAEDNTSSHSRANAASSLKFDCQNTLNGLANTGIRWPQVDDKLLQAFFAKFSKAG